MVGGSDVAVGGGNSATGRDVGSGGDGWLHDVMSKSNKIKVVANSFFVSIINFLIKLLFPARILIFSDDGIRVWLTAVSPSSTH